MRGEREEWSHLLHNMQNYISLFVQCTTFPIAGILLVHCGIGCRLSVAVVMRHPPVVCV